jgi:hypothetical protein
MVAMMARTVAELPQGSRITDYISLGVLNKMIPRPAVDAALKATGRQSARQRDLPAHVVVYYVIALALYMQSSYREVLRCLLEGLQWLADPSVGAKVAGKSGISQARTRLGFEPMQALHDAVVGPVGQPQEAGCGYRQWHLVSLDGSTLDVADERANAQDFGRPGASRGSSAFPQIRFVSLVENGTHVLFGNRMAGYDVGELSLAKEVVTSLSQGMLCLADRNFFGYALWNQAHSTGAELLWRVKKNLRLPCKKRLPDGSYLSRIYPSEKDRRQQTRGRRVRVIEYQLDGVHDAEPLYRLVTSILADAAAPAQELAALYHERWEIETALDELKTHLRGARIILRSKTPDLVRQEFWGLMLAHFAIRSLMHEAARHAGEDPDRLSYVHAVRVVRRKILTHGSIPPSAPSNLPSAGAP